MPDTTTRGGNVGVPAGGILILVSFVFFPWVSVGGLSAMQIVGDPEAMGAAFAVLNVHGPVAVKAARMLVLAPALALMALMVDLSVPTGHRSRLFANLGTAVAGALLSLALGWTALRFGGHLDAGFWGAFMGSLFILVGGVFNVARGE